MTQTTTENIFTDQECNQVSGLDMMWSLKKKKKK